MASRHVHKEAFSLMLYRGVESGEEEWLWNSRDGVTPFIIWSAKDGSEMRHDDWFRDLYAPFYIPPIGSRIFVDCTKEVARASAAKYVDGMIEREGLDWMEGYFESRAHAINVLAEDRYHGGQAPHIEVVNAGMQREFRARVPAGHPLVGRRFA